MALPDQKVARRYLAGHTSYAHQQIVLPAVLCVTRRDPAAAGLPSPAALTDPGDEELLASMAAFGAALHRATEGGTPSSAEQALEKIRATEAEPNFVTPGDLGHSPSLTERVRLAAGGKKGGSPISGLLNRG
ncbi:hypothetical protein ACIHFE_24360 [Streptomyces sp. NPDC052396]|uniref:hypothetical protein n=1 Tax=Streptomyces sp. NPDC052396 TaxID=3365689 RepID=UPI0037D53BF1